MLLVVSEAEPEPAEIKAKFRYNSYHGTTMVFTFIRENIREAGEF